MGGSNGLTKLLCRLCPTGLPCVSEAANAHAVSWNLEHVIGQGLVIPNVTPTGSINRKAISISDKPISEDAHIDHPDLQY